MAHSDPAIELVDVTVEVPGTRILSKINWKLAVGEQAAVLGPNGSGKSTLLRTMTGYGHVTSGSVGVLGESLGRTEIHKLRRRMGVVDPKLGRLLDRGCTAQALVATGLLGHLTTFFDRPTEPQLDLARQALDRVGLAQIARQPFETLSSGQFGRVWLARAMINDPELLILDEPAADFDLLAREALLAKLVELSKQNARLTTVTVTHHLEDLLPTTTQVLVLSNGQVIACGPPDAVLNNQTLSQAFGAPVTVRKENGRWRYGLTS